MDRGSMFIRVRYFRKYKSSIKCALLVGIQEASKKACANVCSLSCVL